MIDLPEAEFAAGIGFWSDATGHALSPLRGDRQEFASLLPPDGAVQRSVRPPWTVLDAPGGRPLCVVDPALSGGAP
ncbi:MAG: hypothetical protein WAL91_04575 [Propionicimonas sp.]